MKIAYCLFRWVLGLIGQRENLPRFWEFDEKKRALVEIGILGAISICATSTVEFIKSVSLFMFFSIL
jgi:hypothetical protein